MPESAPAPNSFSGASGQAGLTWFHLVILPWAPGSHMVLSSATVICLIQSFFGLTTTVSASKATGSSMYLMPALAQSSISFSRIGREALAMSVSPRQNFLKPPPVPEMPTVTRVRALLGLLELFGHRLGDRKHGRGTVNLDQGLGMDSRGGECSGNNNSNFQGFHQQTPLCSAT